MESFNERLFHEKLESVGLQRSKIFVQDNHSCSHKGVLRGLHYQEQPYAQGKLVRVIKGAVYDVVVDLREESSTYLKWVGVELNTINNYMLWVPEGFAHGFLALEDDTHFLYKVTDYYNRIAERTIAWNDPLLAIKWPAVENYVLNSKDAEAKFMGLV